MTLMLVAPITDHAVRDAINFLRAMIPHPPVRSWCASRQITDPEIDAMCKEIVHAQRKEIARDGRDF